MFVSCIIDAFGGKSSSCEMPDDPFIQKKRPILTPFQRENRKIQGVGQKRKVQQTLEFTGLFWRRGWDSNPCAIARKLISSVLSIVEISRKSGAELEVGIPGKCSKIKCFWTSQRRQASRGKGSKNVRCSLRIWRQLGSLERKLERKEREQRATHTRLVLVKQMR